MRKHVLYSTLLIGALVTPLLCQGAEDPKATAQHTEDVIYGHKVGMALVMDVFTPSANANGAAVILVVSGGWVSDHPVLNNQLIKFFVDKPVQRGYTVFAVHHGSQPKFTVPEAIADINRAVRYIRQHASEYQIDPARIGIMGGSAGGHLSLMQGTAGTDGDPKATDPVDRVSSRVQAVASLFPPTDFLNYGGEGKYAFDLNGILAGFRAAVDVREMDSKTHRLERPADENKRLELAATISPITHVSADDPPTLIIHGDADFLVPIQQAERLVGKFKEQGVTSELIVRKGRGHDFNGIDKDLDAMINWFDEHLKKN
jgi:acetyl esterase/lipase